MPRGRPTKYTKIAERLDEIEKLAGFGLTELEIANFLGIRLSTFAEYKIKHIDFTDTLKRGKIKADSNVIEKLYKRTQGYYYEETTTEGKLVEGQIVPTFIKKVKKHIVPDVTACMCWLNNRRKQDWRQSKDEPIDIPLNPEFAKYTDEELAEFVSKRTN